MPKKQDRFADSMMKTAATKKKTNGMKIQNKRRCIRGSTRIPKEESHESRTTGTGPERRTRRLMPTSRRKSPRIAAASEAWLLTASCPVAQRRLRLQASRCGTVTMPSRQRRKSPSCLGPSLGVSECKCIESPMYSLNGTRVQRTMRGRCGTAPPCGKTFPIEYGSKKHQKRRQNDNSHDKLVGVVLQPTTGRP